MSESVDYATEVGQVRALIPDIEELSDPRYPEQAPEFIFSDGHLEALLNANRRNVRRACADALEALGTSEALISKVIATEDLKTDGAKLMQQYVARAKQMRMVADDDENRGDMPEDGGLFIVPDSTYVMPTRDSYHPLYGSF